MKLLIACLVVALAGCMEYRCIEGKVYYKTQGIWVESVWPQPTARCMEDHDAR